MRYINIFIIFISIISLNSCATVFNKDEKKITVTSKYKDAKIIYKDTVLNLPTQISAKRKRENLKLELITDSIKTPIEIPYSLDSKYKYANIGGLLFSPVAYIVDYSGNRKFNYPSKIELDLNNSEINLALKKRIEKDSLRQTKFKRTKGDFILNINLPSPHWFNMGTENKNRYKASGLLGTGLGLDYYYRDKKFLNLEFSVKTNAFDILISSISIQDRFYIYSLVFTDNYRYKYFEFGYGLNTSFSNLKIYSKNKQIDSYLSQNSNQFHLGVSTRASYQITGILNVGIFYKPTFIKITDSKTQNIFESVYGFDLRFKLKL